MKKTIKIFLISIVTIGVIMGYVVFRFNLNLKQKEALKTQLCEILEDKKQLQNQLNETNDIVNHLKEEIIGLKKFLEDKEKQEIELKEQITKTQVDTQSFREERIQAKVKSLKNAVEKEERKKGEATRAERKEYIIDEEDVLGISVWEWGDLTTDAIVRPDGKISFPLVGDVQAEGLTLTELDEELTVRLKEYIMSPEVSVVIRKFGGKKVIILGEVSNPGVYRATGKHTMMEVIALAGGFTDHAFSSSVILIRGDLRKPYARRINLAKVLKRGDLAENISVQPEDIIYVPRTFIGNLNYFLKQLTPVLTAAELYIRWEEWKEEEDD